MASRGAPPLAALSEAARAAILELEELRERGAAACLGAGGPLVLEIGFGRADLLLRLAAERPEARLLGMERSRKRVLKAARRVARAGLQNLRLVCASAEAALAQGIEPGSVSECWICCPDPWPKRRHQGRRLFQPGLVAELERALAPGGRLFVSTDHPVYAEWIDARLRATSELCNVHAPRAWSEEAPARPATAYELEWLAEGRRIAYFEYRKRA
jgi:tRNA (guanine-N7-)-methyltransferase